MVTISQLSLAIQLTDSYADLLSLLREISRLRCEVDSLLLQAYQRGGELAHEEIMEVLNANKDKPFVKRILNRGGG